MIDAEFPDAQFMPEDLIAEADRVAWRFTLQATHTGPFQGIPATGKVVRISGINIVRIADGQIVGNWGVQDALGLLHELGAIRGRSSGS